MERSETEKQFSEILLQIQQAKQRAFQQVNSVLVELYWNIGKYISAQVKTSSWGKGVIKELERFIKTSDPELQGFTDKNLWRMKQFYETYRDDEKLASLGRFLSWTHNRRIMTLKTPEEREFYLLLCNRKNYSVRELDRDVKLDFENPSIGILLCREKNDEVVKYALSRSVSPAVIADYETKLIPKQLLRDKLNEIYALLESKKGE